MSESEYVPTVGDIVGVSESVFGHARKQFKIDTIVGKYAIGETDDCEVLVLPIKRLTVILRPRTLGASAE